VKSDNTSAVEQIRIELQPGGKVLNVRRGASLQDILFAQGVEFPCGGRGRCKGCRVKVLEGIWPAGADEERLLTNRERNDGWRLACRNRADRNLKLELAQWDAAILGDDSSFTFTPRDGLGVAVDLGTTTIVAQLLDLRTGRVLAVRTALNAQARHGADVMSRVEFALNESGASLLQELVRRQLGQLIAELLAATPDRAGELTDVMLVGNTIMHHLFCGSIVEPLSRHPFEFVNGGGQNFSAKTLGWNLPATCTVHFLPCLGSFVGSDLLAGILATKLHESRELVALMDLGTNGEIIVADGRRLLCASTAAGPAFEGARISMGMRAAIGAISEVSANNGAFECRVLGNVPPRGICGSGLVDAIAVGLDFGLIQPNGRLKNGDVIRLQDPVVLTQADVRQLQLAKGAIAAGLRILVQRVGATLADFKRIYLGGAFGNYVNHASARRIGLLDVPPEIVVPAGNTALRGAKLALFASEHGDEFCRDILARTEHVPLNEDPEFQEIFVQELGFPARDQDAVCL
jgi:uncharacterized 2Fe-2S/4Fe-4S cluster protein (DUF4445 family)